MTLRLDSVFVEPSWYPILSKALTEVKNNADKKMKLTARECLQMLETGVHLFQSDQRAQIVFSPTQKKLLLQISEATGLEDAAARFNGHPIGEFDQFSRSRKK